MAETLRSEWVKCGKKCGGCPHGPYWYAYWREGAKVRKRYVGKGKPEPGADGEPTTAREDGPRPDPLDAIFSDRTASVALARRILGLGLGCTAEEGRRAYRAAAAAAHPDRHPGEDDTPARRINAAWSYLKRVMGW